MPRAQTRLQVSLEKREYHPNPDDSRHQLSPTDAPTDLSLFTTESSCAAWNSALLNKLLQPGSEPGIAGRSDSGLSRLGNCCPEVFTRNPSLSEPGRLSEWKLKSAFPSCKNPQEKSTDTMKIILVTTLHSIRLLSA